jgi:hypothetical protein
LKFDHAIRLSQELGLLDGVDSKSIELLRIARNEIHLGRKSLLPDDTFSPVRASGAILTTLDLAKRLASTARARPTKRKTAPQGGAPQPSKLAQHGPPVRSESR